MQMVSVPAALRLNGTPSVRCSFAGSDREHQASTDSSVQIEKNTPPSPFFV